MPELPEVEMVARSLERMAVGRRISAARLLRPRLAPDVSHVSFARQLKGKSITAVSRRGKHILLGLSGGKTLMVHLRMSGRFLLLEQAEPDPKFAHAIFYFDDGMRLVFEDQRHFGFMRIIKTAELQDAKELRKLAPEPFSDDFTVEYLRSTLAGSQRSVKEFLLDQTKVCGLGNIYAAEALFGARVHPSTIARLVPKRKVSLLYTAIRDVFRLAIAHAESQELTASDLEGGYFNPAPGSWMVYDRENEACRICETLIVRLKQGGRSTYFCRKCQRKRA